MGWLRKTLLAPVLKCSSLAELEKELGRMRDEMRSQKFTDRTLKDEVYSLRVENAELKLYTASLIWLLLQKDAFSQTELVEVLETVDRSDGEANGRYEGDIHAWGIACGDADG